MPEVRRQTISDAVAFSRVTAFLAAFLVTPFALAEIAIRTSVPLPQRLAGVVAAASLLIVQKRVPSLRYAAAGAVIAAALYPLAVWLFFRGGGFVPID